MQTIVTESSTDKLWALEASYEKLELSPKNDPDAQVHSFDRELFFHEVMLIKIGRSHLLNIKSPKLSFEISAETAAGIKQAWGEPSKIHLKKALANYGGKFQIGCGLILIIISFPIATQGFAWDTCILGVCIVAIANACRYIIHPIMFLLSIIPPIILIAEIAYSYFVKQQTMSLWWWIFIPILLLSIQGCFKSYKKYRNTDLEV